MTVFTALREARLRLALHACTELSSRCAGCLCARVRSAGKDDVFI